MKIGFTGTRRGMSRWQAGRLQYVLAVFFHADRVVGRQPELFYGTHDVELKGDDEAAAIAKTLGYVLRPMRAERGGELRRDRAVVAMIDVLVAAPSKDAEELRSGTWATIRYARKAGKPIVMLPRCEL